MQQGGSPYGTPPPDMTLFSSSLQPPSAAAAVQQQQQQMAAVTAAAVAEPINVRPPPSLQQQVPSAGPNYEELGSAEDPLGDEAVGGGGMSGGNRWPRQETLALLKIRSDMDAAFRDANLKGPLWEEVSRKLAELGYRRSAKKCKEKFENVHKYYKRTKEGRAGRQDGKSYRFFTQLEALHNTPGASSSSPSVFAPSPSSTATMMGAGSTGGAAASPSARFQTPQQQQQQQQQIQIQQHHHQQQQISAPMPIATAPPQPQMVQMFGQEQSVGAAVAAAGISFSSNTSSDAASDEDDVDEDEEDDEATEEGPSGGLVGKKRKREGEGGGSRKMMAFFEGLMRQVMERQEAMQQRFLEAIEVREKDRMIREEAWRRQEMARLAREHEIEAAERAAAAARDAAVISFLQKLTGQSVPGPTQTTPTTPAPVPAQAPSAAVSIVPTPSQPQPIHHQPPTSTSTSTPTPPSQPQQQQYHQTSALMLPPPRPTSTELVPLPSEPHEGASAGSMSLDPASSRWPKSEVHALIKLRSGLDSRYQESGPKGPLWEEISAGMRGLGYNRSSKRCKEKWENINKYFKKVKESNKKRPEDAKTCPYFHQLDALYRSKQLGNTSSVMPALTQRTQESETQPSPISIMPPPPQQQQQQQQQQQPMNQGDMDTKKDAGGGGSNNGGLSSTFFGDNGGNGDNSTNAMMKKPEDIVKELMGQSNNNEYGRADEPDSDNMDEDDVDDEDDEEEDDGKAQYRIQFQRQNVSGGNGNGGATAAPSSGGGGGKTAAGSFLAMVR